MSSASALLLSSASTSTSSGAFAAFEKWLSENGAVTSRLELKEYEPDVRGCHTLETIDPDQTIICIPLKCLITVEMGMDTPVGRAIVDSQIELDVPKHIFLMIYILQDMKNESSFFKPYYDILPKSMLNLPIFWDDECLSYLEGSYVLEQIKDRKKMILDDYNKICSISPSFQDYVSLADFQWARMCVSSRNFGVVLNGIRTSVLVPYADMLNHNRPRDTRWQFDDSLQAFTVVSTRCILEGGQVFDSYGQKCNHRFLLNYGFSIESNIESDGFCPNEVPIEVDIADSRNDDMHDIKVSYFGESFFRSTSVDSSPKYVRVSICDNANTKLLLGMVRLYVADSVDMDEISNRYLSKYHTISQHLGDNSALAALRQILSSAGVGFRSFRELQYPISMRNEKRAMARLKAICDMYLARYPTSLADDIEKLKDVELMPMYSNIRNATIQVRGEKEVLQFYSTFAQVSIELLQAIERCKESNSIINWGDDNNSSNGSSNSSSIDIDMNKSMDCNSNSYNSDDNSKDQNKSSNNHISDLNSSSSPSMRRSRLDAMVIGLSENVGLAWRPYLALLLKTQAMQLHSY